MIDVESLVKQQQAGVMLIDNLPDNEKMVLQYYAMKAAEGITRLGEQHGAPPVDVIMNSFRNGIALGLGIKIINGQVKLREDNKQ